MPVSNNRAATIRERIHHFHQELIVQIQDTVTERYRSSLTANPVLAHIQ